MGGGNAVNEIMLKQSLASKVREIKGFCKVRPEVRDDEGQTNNHK